MISSWFQGALNPSFSNYTKNLTYRITLLVIYIYIHIYIIEYRHNYRYMYIITHIMIGLSIPTHHHHHSHHPITGHEPRIRLHWARAQWPEICRMGAESVTGCHRAVFYPIFEFQMSQNLWKLPYIAMIILRMPCRICKISGTSYVVQQCKIVERRNCHTKFVRDNPRPQKGSPDNICQR